VRVTVARCSACGATTFSCPALIEDQRIPANLDCLAIGCVSYDPHRDVGFLLAPTFDVHEPSPLTAFQRFTLRVNSHE